MTYNENIERLKSASNYNTSLANKYETENANAIASRKIQEANSIATGLSQFSSTLQEWQEKSKQKALEEGKLQAQQYATEDAVKLAELQQELQTVKEQDTRYHEIKTEMLRLSGPDVYPEADRLAKLSP
jgi:flagellar biosynthesis/type III secretory pathway protein FliH